MDETLSARMRRLLDQSMMLPALRLTTVAVPPEPYEYQGEEAIARFLRDRQARRGANLQLVPARANGQPAFACYLPDAQAPIARAYALFVLTLEGDRISAITWFAERSLFRHFGLPRILPE